MSSLAQVLESPEDHLSQRQREWLSPLGGFGTFAQRSFFFTNRVMVSSMFRWKVRGKESLPEARPLLLAPSHTSSLDPSLLAASLDYAMLRNTRWVAAARAILANPMIKGLNRLARSIPVNGSSALAAGAMVLSQGKNLIWFPEGHRTRDGELGPFKPGIGYLAIHFQVPVVPIRILGAYQAMPPGKRFPKLGASLEVRIGQALHAADEGSPEATIEQRAAAFSQRLRAAVRDLGEFDAADAKG